MSPLGVVEEPKFRIIHDSTFAAGARRRTSVDSDTAVALRSGVLVGSRVIRYSVVGAVFAADAWYIPTDPSMPG